MRILCFLVLLFISTPSQAQIISEWRGPGRTGVYPDTGLLKKWPEGGPEKVWSVAGLGHGYSSPALGRDMMYVSGRIKDTEYLTALDYQGYQLWKVPFGRAWNQSYPDTRTTPTLVGDKLYMISGMGEVACHDARTGKQIWMRNAYEEFQGVCNLYGVSESPLVYKDKVFYTPGGKQTSMIALDKENGDLVWKTVSLGDSAAYVSPLLVTHNGRDMIVNLMGNILFGVNPDKGEILWSFDYLSLENDIPNVYLKVTNCNTPVYHQGDLFVTKGYNHPAAMFSLSTDGRSISLKWTNHLLDTHFGGNVLVDGFLYGSTWINNGDGNWGCIEWETGINQWEGRMNSKGATIYADGMLYSYDEKRGELALVEASPKKFNILSSFRIDFGTGPHWAHPVIHQGRLYVRHGEEMGVFELMGR